MVTPLALVPLVLASAFSGDPPPSLPPAAREVDLEEHLGRALPLDLAFVDDGGRAVRLGDFFGDGRPVVLVLAYFRCPSLCGLVLHATATGLAGIDGARSGLGDGYRVLTVSIDPGDKPAVARLRQAEVLQAMNRPEARTSWPFVVGGQAAIHALADAVGERYAWDPASNQFAHPAVLVVLSPTGTISRYLYGVDFPPRDLKLALVEAGAGRVGSITDRLLLTCYRFDPATRRYGLYLSGAFKLGGLLILGLLGGAIALLRRRERRGPRARLG